MRDFFNYTRYRVAFVGVAITGTMSLAACGDAVIDFQWEDEGGYATPENDAGADADAAEDAGPNIDGGDGACDLSCEGDCLPFHPEHFSLPFLVWTGSSPDAAPACPAGAPIERPLLKGEPSIPPASCGACTCGPSWGFCALPSTITAYAAPGCPADAPSTIADPPASWDGACTTENAIPAGLSCGPGTFCVQSINIEPMPITDEACVPHASTPPQLPPPSWGLFARRCEGSAFGQCSPAEHCAPALVDGFRQCVEQPGVHECPETEYTERILLYEDFVDDRTCAACTCGAPVDSYCQGWIGVYSDAACGASVVTGNLWSEGPTCLDVTPHGQAIGSKVAAEPVYHPGTCEAHGGELEGSVALDGPLTLCCLP